jgi:spermidine/putrescine transport system ATP-binding protein
MSVADNVGFGLRYQRLTKAEARQRVEKAMGMVQLTGFEKRRPGQLSGGQQQRVALARALVLEAPVLLLDEPLGALDARLRVDLQVELKRIQETLGVTFVYVTHDQDEALTMSDRVAVMRDGRMEQLGAPQELYEEPATAFVANFLGSSNLIPATLAGRENGHSKLVVGSFTLRAGRPATDVDSGEAMAMIRPERVRLEAHRASGENRVPGMVEEVVYLGFHQELRVRLATGALVKANVPNDGAAITYEQGDPVAVHLPADCVRVLDAEA